MHSPFSPTRLCALRGLTSRLANGEHWQKSRRRNRVWESEYLIPEPSLPAGLLQTGCFQWSKNIASARQPSLCISVTAHSLCLHGGLGVVKSWSLAPRYCTVPCGFLMPCPHLHEEPLLKLPSKCSVWMWHLFPAVILTIQLPWLNFIKRIEVAEVQFNLVFWLTHFISKRKLKPTYVENVHGSQPYFIFPWRLILHSIRCMRPFSGPPFLSGTLIFLPAPKVYANSLKKLS